MNPEHDPIDDPIDDLLAGLRADVPEMTDRAFASARTHLQLAVEPAPPPVAAPDDVVVVVPQGRSRLRRSPPRLIATAAAVVALAAGVVVAQTGFDDGAAPVANAAAVRLNSSADKITATDQPLRPGQYRYIVTHSWNTASYMIPDRDGDTGDTGVAFLVESRYEVWLPADPAEECTVRANTGENFKWLAGTPELAREWGIDPPSPNSSVHRTPCGDIAGGNWQQPSTDFFASLPRDPDALYDRLRRDVGDRGSGHELVYATDALSTGRVPADLRAALYRALAKVPNLEITEQVANLDGKKGTAYGVTRDGRRLDVIIDPATGQYIGERQVDLDGGDGIPAGTVTGYSSVETPVVVDEVDATG